MKHLCPATAGLLVSLLAHAAHAAAYVVDQPAPPPGTQGAFVGAADGPIYAGNVIVGGSSHAALITPGFLGHVDLHPNPDGESTVVGGGDGQQVGWVGGAQGQRPVVWSGTAASAVYLLPAGATTGAAYDAANGSQVGYVGGGTYATNHAILWHGSASNFIDLHPAGYANTVAAAIGGARQVGYGGVPGDAGNHHALVWAGSADTVVDLNPAGHVRSRGLDIAGDVVVGDAKPGPSPGGPGRAALWNLADGGFTDLHPSGYLGSVLSDTNGRSHAGVALTSAGQTHAMVWVGGTAAGAFDLHTLLPSRYASSSVSAIDAAGNVYGSAVPSGGLAEFVMWRVVPEPSALSVVPCAAWLLARRVRRGPRGRRVERRDL